MLFTIVSEFILSVKSKRIFANPIAATTADDEATTTSYADWFESLIR